MKRTLLTLATLSLSITLFSFGNESEKHKHLTSEQKDQVIDSLYGKIDAYRKIIVLDDSIMRMNDATINKYKQGIKDMGSLVLEANQALKDCSDKYKECKTK